jgi:hypothetical protein
MIISKSVMSGILCFSPGILAPLIASELFMLRPTAIVLDDHGNPLPKVHVNFAFGISFQSRIGNVQSGPSDAEGKFSASMKTDGQLTVTATKPGYYKWQDSSMFFSPDIKTGKIQPYDPADQPIQILMRKILNPIPLYAKRMKLDFPKSEGPYGFDMQVADWVAPLGKGSVVDFIVTIQLDRPDPSDRDIHHAKLEITFPNPGDGWQIFEAQPSGGSLLRLPHQAPTNGYHSVLRREFGSHGYRREIHNDTGSSRKRGSYGYDSPNHDKTNYFLRTRTIMDAEGNIIAAHYAKIHGQIRVYGLLREDPGLDMEFYFNPTANDRNLEFDPAKNLMRGVGIGENIDRP